MLSASGSSLKRDRTIRFFYPPSQGWASQALHILGLHPTWQVAPTRWRRENLHLQHILSSPGLRSPFLSIHQDYVLSHIHTWSLLSLLCGWHLTTFLLPLFWHPGGNMHLCVPGRYLSLDIGPPPQAQPWHDGAALTTGEGLPAPRPLNHGWQLHSVSSQSAKNLGVTLDNTLSFSANIKIVTRSCRFMF